MALSFHFAILMRQKEYSSPPTDDKVTENNTRILKKNVLKSFFSQSLGDNTTPECGI